MKTIAIESCGIQISIIIIVWNAKQFALACLDSLQAGCSNPGIEMILVDNASSDGSPEAIAAQYPCVHLIRNSENFGFAKANNIGLLASRGHYVCFINSDVVVPQGCLEKMASYMDANPDIAVLGPRMISPDRSIGRSYMGLPTPWRAFCRALALDALMPSSRLFGRLLMNYFDCKITTDVEVLNGWFWMVRRDAINEVGLLDEHFFMYGEDVDWCKRFKAAGWRIVYYSDAEALHYGGSSSARAPFRFFLEMHRARLYYWKKHHGRMAVILFMLCAILHQLIRILGYSLLLWITSEDRYEARNKLRRSIMCLKWLLTRNESIPNVA